jgi:hypothetical protein
MGAVVGRLSDGDVVDTDHLIECAYTRMGKTAPSSRGSFYVTVSNKRDELRKLGLSVIGRRRGGGYSLAYSGVGDG